MKRTPLARRAPLRAIRAPSKQRRPRNTGPTAKVVALIRDRDQDQCILLSNACAGTGVIHHRRNRQSGGSSNPALNACSNLAILCAHHNDLVESDLTVANFARGWGVKLRQHQNPRFVRMRHPRLGYVFLLDDGGVSYGPPEDFTPQASA